MQAIPTEEIPEQLQRDQAAQAPLKDLAPAWFSPGPVYHFGTGNKFSKGFLEQAFHQKIIPQVKAQHADIRQSIDTEMVEPGKEMVE